jgi:DNA-binding response OmpR family regulator
MNSIAHESAEEKVVQESGMGSKVLVVDDEAYIRMLIELTLEDLQSEGVEIITAEDGAQALDIIKSERPNLVFLDVMMPNVTGFDVCYTVKNEWQYDDVFIVMLTAKGQDYDVEKGLMAGADVYMTKPFDPDELLEKAEEILGL